MKHCDWTPFRPEKITDVDIRAKKRKHSPSEVERQADEACSKMRVDLDLAFTCFRALKERLGMKSDMGLVCLLLDRCQTLVSLC